MVKTRFRIEVRRWRSVRLSPGDLFTLSEAAVLLGLSSSAMGDLVYRGVLLRVEDMEEPNPTKRTRVYREDVEAEIARRRVRRGEGDSRLKGRVK